MFDDSCNIVQENETDIWRKTNHLVTKKDFLKLILFKDKNIGISK